ncbi:ABC transporter permease [Lutimonas vermicola]|uniref:FtsX-like permease family protein n=1 Tax=Lutimonas vermicola TaxID=414288 RepID=A0ABU9KZ14_9FLAO
MNYELFIARRIIASKERKNSVSSPIIKISILAIAIGIVVMLFSVATGVGLQKKIKEKISGFNGDIQISNYDANNSKVTVTPVSRDQDFYPEFKSVPNVRKVQVYATKAGIIRTPNEFEGIILKGVDKDYDWSFFAEYLMDGKLPVFGNKTSNDVLISAKTAARLGIKTGDDFHMFFVKDDPNQAPNSRKFKVCGIFDSGFEEFDEAFIIGDIKHIQRINKWDTDQIGGFELFVYDFDKLKETGFEVYEQIDPSLNAFTTAEKFPAIFEWLGLFDTNIIVIIAIMILIAGINMITALLVLILERTQMIGILKALGNHNWSIRKIFLYNASFLIGKGLFWGNLIGVGLLMIQKHFGVITLNPETYYVNQAPVYLSIPTLIWINSGTLFLCVLMLIVPSFIVSKISPVKAIKFD